MLVVLAGLAWLGGLFAVALWGKPRGRAGARLGGGVRAVAGGVLHLLDLLRHGHAGGAVGLVAAADLVGSILLYALGIGVLQRLVRVAREVNATSIADLVARASAPQPGAGGVGDGGVRARHRTLSRCS